MSINSNQIQSQNQNFNNQNSFGNNQNYLSQNMNNNTVANNYNSGQSGTNNTANIDAQIAGWEKLLKENEDKMKSATGETMISALEVQHKKIEKQIEALQNKKNK